MKQTTSISHDEALIAELRRSPQFAAEYLRAALEEEDEPRVLLLALRQIAEARGGLGRLARAAGVERDHLDRVLSGRGDPKLGTIMAVARALGLRITVEAA